MSEAIYVSINKNAVNKILCQEKNHEFRNYVPKQTFVYLFVYVTMPICELRYVIHLNRIIKYPEVIKYDGDGNDLFNIGQKGKYAYEIDSVYELKNPIKLIELREKYCFAPPQSFAYSSCYPELTNYIVNQEKKILWRNNDAVQIKSK